MNTNNAHSVTVLKTVHSKELVQSVISTSDKINTKFRMLAICKLTGISIHIVIADTPGMHLDYPHPFSIYKNVVEFSSLPFKTLSSNYSIELVAGCLITALSEYHLLGDKLSGVHRNALLSQLPHYTLVDAIRFVTSLTKRQASWLPKLSLEACSTDSIQQQSVHDTVKNYILECKAIVQPESDETGKTATTKDDKREYSAKLLGDLVDRAKNKIPASIIVKENKDNFKVLLLELIADGIAPKKLTNLLKMLNSGSNLFSIMPEIREKLSIALKKLEDETANELAELICHPVYYKKAKVEIATAISSQDEFQPKVKPTLAQILAARQQGLPANTFAYDKEQEQKNEEIEEQLEEIDEDGLELATLEGESTVDNLFDNPEELGDDDGF